MMFTKKQSSGRSYANAVPRSTTPSKSDSLGKNIDSPSNKSPAARSLNSGGKNEDSAKASPRNISNTVNRILNKFFTKAGDDSKKNNNASADYLVTSNGNFNDGGKDNSFRSESNGRSRQRSSSVSAAEPPSQKSNRSSSRQRSSSVSKNAQSSTLDASSSKRLKRQPTAEKHDIGSAATAIALPPRKGSLTTQPSFKKDSSAEVEAESEANSTEAGESGRLNRSLSVVVRSKNNSSDFIGVKEYMKRLVNQVRKFEQWARDRNWKKFHTSHFDYWTFPLGDRNNFGLRYSVFEEEVFQFHKDKTFMKTYRRGLELVSLAWGWNLSAMDFVANRDIRRGQTWSNWPIRLYRAHKSAVYLGLTDEPLSLQKYADILLDKNVPFIYNQYNLKPYFRPNLRGQMTELDDLECKSDNSDDLEDAYASGLRLESIYSNFPDGELSDDNPVIKEGSSLNIFSNYRNSISHNDLNNASFNISEVLEENPNENENDETHNISELNENDIIEEPIVESFEAEDITMDESVPVEDINDIAEVIAVGESVPEEIDNHKQEDSFENKDIISHDFNASGYSLNSDSSNVVNGSFDYCGENSAEVRENANESYEEYEEIFVDEADDTCVMPQHDSNCEPIRRRKRAVVPLKTTGRVPVVVPLLYVPQETMAKEISKEITPRQRKASIKPGDGGFVLSRADSVEILTEFEEAVEETVDLSQPVAVSDESISSPEIQARSNEAQNVSSIGVTPSRFLLSSPTEQVPESAVISLSDDMNFESELANSNNDLISTTSEPDADEFATQYDVNGPYEMHPIEADEMLCEELEQAVETDINIDESADYASEEGREGEDDETRFNESRVESPTTLNAVEGVSVTDTIESLCPEDDYGKIEVSEKQDEPQSDEIDALLSTTAPLVVNAVDDRPVALSTIIEESSDVDEEGDLDDSASHSQTVDDENSLESTFVNRNRKDTKESLSVIFGGPLIADDNSDDEASYNTQASRSRSGTFSVRDRAISVSGGVQFRSTENLSPVHQLVRRHSISEPNSAYVFTRPASVESVADVTETITEVVEEDDEDTTIADQSAIIPSNDSSSNQIIINDIKAQDVNQGTEIVPTISIDTEFKDSDEFGNHANLISSPEKGIGSTESPSSMGSKSDIAHEADLPVVTKKVENDGQDDWGDFGTAMVLFDEGIVTGTEQERNIMAEVTLKVDPSDIPKRKRAKSVAVKPESADCQCVIS